MLTLFFRLFVLILLLLTFPALESWAQAPNRSTKSGELSARQFEYNVTEFNNLIQLIENVLAGQNAISALETNFMNKKDLQNHTYKYKSANQSMEIYQEQIQNLLNHVEKVKVLIGSLRNQVDQVKVGNIEYKYNQKFNTKCLIPRLDLFKEGKVVRNVRLRIYDYNGLFKILSIET